jgi:hypothetical protein
LKSESDSKFQPFNELELMALSLSPHHRSPNDWRLKQLLEQGDDLVKQYLRNTTTSSTTPTQDGTMDLDWRDSDLCSAPTTDALDTGDEFVSYSVMRLRPGETLLQCWKRVAPDIPELTTLACKIFCIPATQTTSEREFSLTKHILTPLRTSLDTDTANKLLTTSSLGCDRNLNIIQKRKRHRTQAERVADNDRRSSLDKTLREKAQSRLGDYIADLEAAYSVSATITDSELVEGEDFHSEDYQSGDDSDEDYDEGPRKQAKSTTAEHPHSKAIRCGVQN